MLAIAVIPTRFRPGPCAAMTRAGVAAACIATATCFAIVPAAAQDLVDRHKVSLNGIQVYCEMGRQGSPPLRLHFFGGCMAS